MDANSIAKDGSVVEEPKPKINWKITIIFGLMVSTWSVLWAVYNNYVPIMLQAGNINFDVLQVARTLGFGLGPFATGIIMSIDNVAGLFGGPIAGAISDRKQNRKKWSMQLIPWAVISFALLPLSTSMIQSEQNGHLEQLILPFTLFIISGMIMLFSSVVIAVNLQAVTYSMVPSELRSQVTGYIVLISSIGSVIAYAGSGVLYNIHPIIPFWVASVFMAVVGFLYNRWIQEPEDAYSSEKISEDQKGQLKSIFSLLNELSPGEMRDMWITFLSWALFGFGTAPLQTYASSFVVNDLGQPESTGALLAAVWFLGTMIFTIPSGYLPKRIGRKNTIKFGSVLLIVFPLLIYLFPSIELTYICLAFMGMGQATYMVNFSPIISDIIPTKKMLATVMGFSGVMLTLGVVLSVPFFGWIIETFGNKYILMFPGLSICSLVAMILLFFVKNGEAKA